MKMKKLFQSLPDPKGIEIDGLDIEGKKELLRSYFPFFNDVIDRLIRAKFTGPKTDNALSKMVHGIGDIIDVPGMGGFDHVEFKVKDEWNKIRLGLVLFLQISCFIRPKGRRIMALVIDLVDDILDNHVEE